MRTLNENQQVILAQANQILAGLLNENDVLDSPNLVKDFLRTRIAHLPHEVFCVLYLDNQNRLIRFVEMFRGTLNQAAVYPREVAKEALCVNAASVILAHNHPSGDTTPSAEDKVITQRISEALRLFDIAVLDHVIATCAGSFSFAELGLI